MKRTLYSCECFRSEHIFFVCANEEDLTIEIHLAPLPWHRRLIHAFHYILGRRSRYRDFEEILLSPESALNLGDQLVNWAAGPIEFQPNDVF